MSQICAANCFRPVKRLLVAALTCLPRLPPAAFDVPAAVATELNARSALVVGAVGKPQVAPKKQLVPASGTKEKTLQLKVCTSNVQGRGRSVLSQRLGTHGASVQGLGPNAPD